jgi:hypothetical protein
MVKTPPHIAISPGRLLVVWVEGRLEAGPLVTVELFCRFANRYQAPLDLLQMQAHGRCRAAKVALGDRFDNPFMIDEAVMVRRRTSAF